VEILTSRLLAGFPWLEHGFGTRQAELSQDGMASLTQVHSALVIVADRPSGCVGTGDALITNRPGFTVSIRSADCFPILLVDTRNRAIAAVHAGWRGTAARIGAEVVARMALEFGTSPGDIYAAIGPGIGACCYEVGEEVARQFGLDRAGRIDLADANRRQLLAAGVPQGQIETLAFCTCCDPAHFHSYRRDKLEAGRMISYIRLL
jgi:YfiH family protein